MHSTHSTPLNALNSFNALDALHALNDSTHSMHSMAVTVPSVKYARQELCVQFAAMAMRKEVDSSGRDELIFVDCVDV
jgi:hypothetical protein